MEVEWCRVYSKDLDVAILEPRVLVSDEYSLKDHKTGIIGKKLL